MEHQKSITVTKTASAQASANKVSITVTVTGEAKKSAAAIELADEKASELVKAFERFGDGVTLGAGGINVGATYSDRKVAGYRAMRTFAASFAYDKETVVKVLDALGELPVEWRVAFSFEDDGSERTRLLRSAVTEAKADAKTIADAAGVKLGTLVKVEYAPSFDRPVMLRAASFGENAAAPEQISLSETVVCSWDIA